MKRVGEGDFTVREEEIDVKSRDEIGILASSFRAMYSSIREEIRKAAETGRLTAKKAYSLAEMAQVMSASADRIASAVQSLSTLAQDNAATLEEATASIEEIASGSATGAEKRHPRRRECGRSPQPRRTKPAPLSRNHEQASRRSARSRPKP